jgi:hypothetical protein
VATPLCPRCQKRRLVQAADVADRMIGDCPATYLRCDCGYARWYLVVLGRDDRLALVAASPWWQEWLVLVTVTAIIVIGSLLLS